MVSLEHLYKALHSFGLMNTMVNLTVSHSGWHLLVSYNGQRFITTSSMYIMLYIEQKKILAPEVLTVVEVTQGRHSREMGDGNVVLYVFLFLKLSNCSSKLIRVE